MAAPPRTANLPPHHHHVLCPLLALLLLLPLVVWGPRAAGAVAPPWDYVSGLLRTDDGAGTVLRKTGATQEADSHAVASLLPCTRVRFVALTAGLGQLTVQLTPNPAEQNRGWGSAYSVAVQGDGAYYAKALAGPNVTGPLVNNDEFIIEVRADDSRVRFLRNGAEIAVSAAPAAGPLYCRVHIHSTGSVVTGLAVQLTGTAWCPASGTSFALVTRGCSTEINVDYPIPPIIVSVPTGASAGCCQQCRALAGCSVYTWLTGNCHFRPLSALGARTDNVNNNFASGVVGFTPGDAQRFAGALGAQLATVTSPAEQACVTALVAATPALPSTGAWLGASSATGTAWQWTNPEPFGPYSNWAPGEPAATVGDTALRVLPTAAKWAATNLSALPRLEWLLIEFDCERTAHHWPLNASTNLTDVVGGLGGSSSGFVNFTAAGMQVQGGGYAALQPFPLGPPFTVSVLVRTDAFTGTWARVLDWGTGIELDNFYIAYYDVFGSLRSMAYSPQTYTLTASGAFALGAWSWLVMKHFGSGRVELWVNGALLSATEGSAMLYKQRLVHYVGKSNWGVDPVTASTFRDLRVSTGAPGAACPAAWQPPGALPPLPAGACAAMTDASGRLVRSHACRSP